MTQQQTATTVCERCGQPLSPGQLVCTHCGGLVHYRRLNELTAQALRLEATNPAAATMIWRQVLDLLPPQLPQYAQVYQRIGALAGGWSPTAPAQQVPRPAARPVRPPDPLAVGLLKTGGSMLVSIVVYYAIFFQSWTLAIAFVVLMLIHEMGHVLAMRYYGLSASPPIFIPFIGALINLRQQPPNAWVESVVGMGGPFLGTIGAFACYGLSYAVGNPEYQKALLVASFLGFFLNLFNLLPVPPLDGGRITAAISPWIWLVGLIGLGLLIVRDLWAPGGGFGVFILVLILFYALPRVRATLRARGMHLPYYQVDHRKSWSMAALYISLAACLTAVLYQTGGLHWIFHPS